MNTFAFTVHLGKETWFKKQKDWGPILWRIILGKKEGIFWGIKCHWTQWGLSQARLMAFKNFSIQVGKSTETCIETSGGKEQVYTKVKTLETPEMVQQANTSDTECSIYSHIHRALTAQFPAAIMGAWVGAADQCHPVLHHPPSSTHKPNSQHLGLVCYSLTTGKKWEALRWMVCSECSKNYGMLFLPSFSSYVRALSLPLLSYPLFPFETSLTEITNQT